jgi:hypothetical protein
MKKLAVFGLAAGAVLVAILMSRRGQQSESPQEREGHKAEKRRGMLKKMRAGMDAMPDDFPAVVMLNNVAATRQNSGRILELLKKDRRGMEEPSSERPDQSHKS